MYFIEGGLISFVLAHLVDTTHAVCVLLARELSWPLHESFIGLSKTIFFKFGIIWRDVEGTIFFPSVWLINICSLPCGLVCRTVSIQDSLSVLTFFTQHAWATQLIKFILQDKRKCHFYLPFLDFFFFSNLMNENKCHNLHYCMFRNRFNEVGGSLNEAVWSQEAMAHADL